MRDINIELLKNHDNLPWNLLLSADPSKEVIDNYIKNSSVYVAISKSKVIGVYVLTELDNSEVEIKNIAVDDKHQGKGVGKYLIFDAIKKAKELGFKRIHIGTGNSSFKQLGLYQKCGFRIDGIEKDFFVKNYAEPIYEDEIECTDMIYLSMSLN